MANTSEKDSSSEKELNALDHYKAHDDDDQVLSDLSAGQLHIRGSISPTMIQRLKDKNREWESSKSKGVLTLLDLPVDVLRLIINEASTK